MLERVTKYNRPTIYDELPYKTIWVARIDTIYLSAGNSQNIYPVDTVEQYIQLGDGEIMQWRRLGDFLEEKCTDEMIEGLLDK